jgi:hypothetical protein
VPKFEIIFLGVIVCEYVDRMLAAAAGRQPRVQIKGALGFSPFLFPSSWWYVGK